MQRKNLHIETKAWFSPIGLNTRCGAFAVES